MLKSIFKNIVAVSVIPLCVMSAELTDKEKQLLERSVADYWSEVYPPEIPRAFDVHRNGCPVCGEAIKKHGMYSWIIDSKKPFKVQCPECKTVFPDNDFEAYYKSGFKDKSLLAGKYVDDGRGWRPAPGKPKYWFVAYYNHRINYQDNLDSRTDSHQLALAYKRTGDVRFAVRSLALLDHFADYYSGYNYNKQSRYAEEVVHTYNGRFVNSIWESLFTNRLADAYLWTRDLLNGELEELSAVTGKTPAQIKHNIEENLFRVVANDIMSQNGKNVGNFGMHQRTLLKVAKLLNEPKYAKWVTDFRICNNVVHMPLDYAIYNNIYSDGAPLESPDYNSLWVGNIVEMFYLLKENGIDEFTLHPSTKHIFTHEAKALVCGKFSPASGDSSKANNLGCIRSELDGNEIFYKLDPSPFNARMLMFNLEQEDPERYEQLKQVADMDYGYSSNLLASYGFATLQNGNKKAPTAFVMAFTNYTRHAHMDRLNIDFFAENASMCPDFGYPDSASADDVERHAFYCNTVAHNTVVVNEGRQNPYGAHLLRYEAGDFAQYVSAAAPGVYGIQKYDRGSLVCEVAPGKTIVLDVFRVSGGTRHDWFLHSAGEAFDTDIKLVNQDGANGIPAAKKLYSGKSGSGYQFLRNVKYGTGHYGNCVTLPVDSRVKGDPVNGAALKVHLLNDGEDVYFSEGKPPRTQMNPQEHMVFLTRRRTGTGSLNSVFGTILENTSDERKAYDIETIDSINAGDDVCAALIHLKDGKLLYVFNSASMADFTADGIHFTGEAGALLIDKAQNQGKAFVVGPGSIAINGKVVVQASDVLKDRITRINLADESIELENNVPIKYIDKMFKVGGRAYQVGGIYGNSVKLLEQSMILGRGRMIKVADDKKSGQLSPAPTLASDGMGLYKGDAKDQYIGVIKSYRSGNVSVDTDRELEPNVDYWVSECVPGAEVLFYDSARSTFTLE